MLRLTRVPRVGGGWCGVGVEHPLQTACTLPVQPLQPFWGTAPLLEAPLRPLDTSPGGVFPPAVRQNRLLRVSPVRTSPKPENKRARLFPRTPEAGLGVCSRGRKGSRLAEALGEGCCAPARPWKSRLVLQGAGRESAAQPCPRHR